MIFFTHNDAGNLPEVDTGKSRDTGKIRQFTTIFHIGTDHICLSENPHDTASLLNNRPVFPGMTTLSLFCRQNPYVPLEGHNAVMKLNGEVIAMNGERARSSLCQVHSQFCICISLSLSLSLSLSVLISLSLSVSIPLSLSVSLNALNFYLLPNVSHYRYFSVIGVCVYKHILLRHCKFICPLRNDLFVLVHLCRTHPMTNSAMCFLMERNIC